MTTIRKAVLLFTTFLIAAAPLALAQGTYTQIDAPGAISTFAYGIDTAGDIVGQYVDCCYSDHGFLLSGGVYTTIDYPGASVTGLYGMNDLGQFVGVASNPNVGFLYASQTQTFTTIAFPKAINTFPTAINNAGMIAGSSETGNRGVSVGFTLVSSKYRAIFPTGAPESTVTAVDAAGKVVGNVSFRQQLHINFLYGHGGFRHLEIPNAPGAAVEGVNPAGTAYVGYYQPSSGVYAGFLYQNKTLTALQFPGSTETVAEGVDAAGEVVGIFADSSGSFHGFTWTPPADAVKKQQPFGN